jgi:hypothetical protein
MNIVSEMMDVNFTSSMPIHISAVVNEKVPQNKTVVIDNISGYKKEDISLIIHPGQTRAQCSVFCKRNLNNILFYIPKKFKNRILLTNFNNITKIDTIEKLLKVYGTLPEITDDKKDLELNINAYEHSVTKDDILNNIKTHYHPFSNHSEIVPLAKAYYMYNIKKDPKVDVHPSTTYIDNSYRSFNYFMDKVHNSRVNIYSSCKPSVLRTYLTTITQKFLKYSSINSELENNESKVRPEHSLESILLQAKDLLGKKYKDEFDSIIRKISLFDNDLNKIKESKLEVYAAPNVIKTKKTDFKEIVELNSYKGYCIYIDESLKENLYRDQYELLFFTNWNVAVTRSIDNKLAIINCEHEYWKTNNNYKEWILTKEMYYD